MKIITGKIYVNKTKKYLLPIVKDYGNELVSKLSSIHKLAMGIHDDIIPDHFNFNNHIFILVDVSIKPNNFNKMIQWLRLQSYYAADYSFDDIIEGNQHMIVLKLPDKHKTIYNHFMNSKFSKMYTKDMIKNYFKSDDIRFGVLTRSETTVKSFVDKINAKHGRLLDYEYSDEVEFNIDNNEEIFNYGITQ
jgi:hypothetical protein